MIAPVSMTVPALGGMRCELQRDERGDWWAFLWKLEKKNAFGNRHRTMVVFASDHAHHGPRFEGPRFEGEHFELVLDGTYITLPEASWKRLKAWHAQVPNAPRGDNRGVPAGGSHAGPDAAAGQPGAAVEGELQPTPPYDDARPGLRQAGGRQAPPAQVDIPAGAA